mmetsp:Transcript_9498/g.28318  ORF Transcript_9498/g.28318 Transcript_9498/m.28318 type:complete len:874 (+) Transcript_9498:369-2990(+)|eukprot:CAMPEP_0172369146 /NCGR_PEP_ID=MMETSP1060-20121228/31242_1 /TAXON_ID=37318 /ORGANISM="Pseudo-nitzschia pungens, Strain cf. cingulata" /LENGTH=873 /DNA_ID=CAMNT_0013093965 /DNA_START=298 /DNA_END=2919 /DNA_ORIENTATION=+
MRTDKRRRFSNLLQAVRAESMPTTPTLAIPTLSRKRRAATPAAARKTTTQSNLIGMIQIMVIALALPSFVSKRMHFAKALVTKQSTRIGRTSKALQMAVDSRELRFFSSSSKNNSNNVLGDYVNQEWMVATATSGRTSQEKSVLALAGTGLDDVVSMQNQFDSNDNENFNLEKMDSNGNKNGKNSEVEPAVSAKSEEELAPFYFQHKINPPKRGYGPYINLSPEERELFMLLRKAKDDGKITTTLRVAGGWVRDKLLATPEFSRSGPDRVKRPTRRTPQRLTSKYKAPSSLSVSSSSLTTSVPSAGRQGSKVIGGAKSKKNGMKNDPSLLRFQQQAPVDIDIALDDMLGREFAELLNKYLTGMGEKTHGVGVVLKNPEKSKHLETATMKVGTFWIDFVNLRAEEYTEDSRIPDLMRIGTPAEDAFRRDLTINSLFYNVNNGQVEDWTGRGFNDLRRCVIATPLAPLTTLLDDPLRTLRSVRFAARLHFTMDASLKEAAMDDRVRKALAEKVSRERIGCEVDLMLRSPDPVGAMRLLINLKLAKTVFPIENLVTSGGEHRGAEKTDLLEKGLRLLSITYDQLEESKMYTPVWCDKSYRGSYTTHGVEDIALVDDGDALRYMWYAAFLKPFYDNSGASDSQKKTRKLNRSVVSKLLVDELKRPTREAEAVEKIMKGANDFKKLMNSGSDYSAMSVLLSDIRVCSEKSISGSKDGTKMICSMNGMQVFTATENDPVWQHAMEFRLSCSKVIRKVGPLWRAALFLAMSEHITEALEGDPEFVIEGDFVDESQEDLRQREIERYDSFATAMQRIGLVGIWGQKPLLDGGQVKKVLANVPHGPVFRDIMEEQEKWSTLHPCASADILARHLAKTFPDYL